MDEHKLIFIRQNILNFIPVPGMVWNVNVICMHVLVGLEHTHRHQACSRPTNTCMHITFTFHTMPGTGMKLRIFCRNYR